MSSQNTEKLRVIASSKNWIEGVALTQLKGTSDLPGMVYTVGLPDLHPGKAGPVGAAFVSEGVFYPHLVGNDVGCGMGWWASDLTARAAKLDKWEKKLTDLDQPWSGDVSGWLEKFGVAASAGDMGLGTIGGGNHFAELQRIEKVEDEALFNTLELKKEGLFVLVHSGSRGLGQAVLRWHHDKHGFGGLDENCDDAKTYLEKHDHAVKWAKASRALIAQRFLHSLGSEARKVFDLSHNYVAREELERGPGWIHRKGANPSTQGVLVIPGSRGSLSYLIQPVGDQESNARSLSHGAGRKWARSDCKERLRGRFDEQALQRTELGGRVICEDRELLYEEAPQAYKKIEVVVQDLVDAGLIKVIATLRPLITYKLRRNA